MSSAQHYITQRIIDACLRENVCDIITKGEVIASLPDNLTAHWPNEIPEAWIKISHINTRVLYVPVAPSHFMQIWRAVSDAWLMQYSISNNNITSYQKGYKAWLTELSTELSVEAKSLFLNYIEEANCAVSHRVTCKQALSAQKEVLNVQLSEQQDWQESLLFSDQVASYLDHPFYPTARAKVGFDTEDLTLYAPEFAAQFKLNWMAIAKVKSTLTSVVPACWPSMSDVGLDESLAITHSLFPLHPLTANNTAEFPAGVIIAPKSALVVQASLSVRTLALIDFPGVHIKVPLLMATLGAKNIRSIKPSTLYDGHWFECTLTMLAEHDDVLSGCMEHVDEQHGGHLGDHKLCAYIVRRYPLPMRNKQLVPVAALASLMPDGRLYLAHLADHYYQGRACLWFGEYITLLLKVHLRLWLKYGIALESNQQNAILAYSLDLGLSLVMKDNDSARLLAKRYHQNLPSNELTKNSPTNIIDKRIFVDSDEALAQMFTTITLQLDIAAIIEAMVESKIASSQLLYSELRRTLIRELNSLQGEGIETSYARQYLLEQTHLPVKYLLCSGSLLSKAESGANDVNKFYGQTAPNFLLKTFCNTKSITKVQHALPLSETVA